MTIGAFIVTKDGAPSIPAVVANLRQFADRIIVCVDSRSADNSLTVARATGAITVTRDIDQNTYESTLNRMVDLLDTDWVSYLHDDELVGPDFIAALPDMLTSRIAWRFPHYNMISDAEYITSQPYWPDHQLRLIPRRMWIERGGWPEHIHASPAWPCEFADVGIFHYKFVWKSLAFRQARLGEWMKEWTLAGGDHYRAFSIHEGRQIATAPVPERLPEQARLVEVNHVSV